MAETIDDATGRPASTAVSCRVAGRGRRFARDASGATSIEYALIAGLVFMLVVGSIRLYSSRMNTVYGQITGAMSQIN